MNICNDLIDSKNSGAKRDTKEENPVSQIRYMKIRIN